MAFLAVAQVAILVPAAGGCRAEFRLSRKLLGDKRIAIKFPKLSLGSHYTTEALGVLRSIISLCTLC